MGSDIPIVFEETTSNIRVYSSSDQILTNSYLINIPIQVRIHGNSFLTGHLQVVFQGTLTVTPGILAFFTQSTDDLFNNVQLMSR